MSTIGGRLHGAIQPLCSFSLKILSHTRSGANRTCSKLNAHRNAQSEGRDVGPFGPGDTCLVAEIVAWSLPTL